MSIKQTASSERNPGAPAERFKALSHLFMKSRGDRKGLKNAGTENGADDYIKALELLYGEAQNTTSIQGVSKLLEATLSITNQALGVSSSSMLLVDAEGKGHYFRVADNGACKKLSRMMISLDSGIAPWVYNNDKPLTINDVTVDKRFNDEIDSVTDFVTKSVISVPMHQGQNVIGVLEATNRIDGKDFREKELAALTELASNEAIILLASMAVTAINNITQHQILIDWYKNVFETLITAVDSKDLYASGHSSRVKEYAMMAASSLSLPMEVLQAIELGALLHDIGKIWIHDNVLRKAGPLTDKEWYMMRKHAQKGAHMLNGIPYLEKAREIVLHHHERYDGKGYPRGLKGRDIPIGARLVAVADAYDTMTTEHSYRDKMSADESISQLIAGKETQFCPVAVDALVAALKRQGDAEKHSVKHHGDKDAADADDSELYEGDVTLSIMSPEGFRAVRQFKKNLEKNDGLKIVLESWSEIEGTIIILSLQKPLALPNILKKMPIVGEVTKEQNRLAVTLKVPTEQKVLQKGLSLT